MATKEFAPLDLDLGDQYQIVTTANGTQNGVFVTSGEDFLVGVQLNGTTTSGMALTYNDLTGATVYKL